MGTNLLQFAINEAKKKGFKRAEAEMAIKNIGSWKVALKCGFTIKGTKKKHSLPITEHTLTPTLWVKYYNDLKKTFIN